MNQPERRKGTIALITLCMTTVVHLVGGIWWAATISADVKYLTLQVGVMQATTYTRDQAEGDKRATEFRITDLARRVGAVEERTK